jgi:hypothetical protein
VTAKLDPRFTIRTAPERLVKDGDPMRRCSAGIDIAAALAGWSAHAERRPPAVRGM